MTDLDSKDVTYLDDVVATIKEKLNAAGSATQTKVLPGARRKVMAPLMEANALLGSVAEVLQRSGMGKRLGFVKHAEGIQPVMGTDAEKTAEPAPVKGD